MLDRVVKIRRDICERNKCAGADFTDPCAACPNGHWGVYTQQGCGGTPPVVEQVRNLGRAIVQAVKDPTPVSSDEQVRRLAICGQCEFFNKGKCNKCGCHLAFKTWLKAWHCPIGKW